MRWIEAQLAARRPEDRPLAERDRAFPVLTASSDELVRELTEARRERQAARMAGEVGDSGPRMSPERRPTNAAATSDRRELRLLAPQLQPVTLIRAIEADDQLGEVMADFWLAAISPSRRTSETSSARSWSGT